jgi:hypothetical protein
MQRITRRKLFQATVAGALGWSAAFDWGRRGWCQTLADQVAGNRSQQRHCILLWMNGGPSQTDTFDMKPGHAHGGEFKEIQTPVPGLQISEHLPGLAARIEDLAIVRGLSTKEGDHGRGTYLMRTGHPPTGPVKYPTLGAALSKQLGSRRDELPNYVSVAPYRAFNQEAFEPGFLGPRFAALTVGASDVAPAQPVIEGERDYASLRVDDLAFPADLHPSQAAGRLQLWNDLQAGFLKHYNDVAPRNHDTVYRRALQLMNSRSAQAFDLSEESAKVRATYGRGQFGQGCLLARRLVERGVAFVDVTLGSLTGGSIGWDTHQNNFETVKQLSAELDKGWSTLMSELSERGLLESTTILWMGEFGRTPKINEMGGRDHFPNAWSCVFAGGGIRGGQAYGKTSPDGTEIESGKVGVGDVLATLCTALGVDPNEENESEQGRPIRIAEGEPISDVLT